MLLVVQGDVAPVGCPLRVQADKNHAGHIPSKSRWSIWTHRESGTDNEINRQNPKARCVKKAGQGKRKSTLPGRLNSTGHA